MTIDTIADQVDLTTANVADTAVTPDVPAATPTESTPSDPTTARRSSIAAAFEALSAEEQGEEAKPAPKAEPAAATATRTDPITGRTVEPMKPPASMPPALREEWGTVNPRFQKYWLDRERDMASTLTTTSDDRKFAKEMRELIAPHEGLLSQLGTTASRHVGELLELSRNLQAGNSQQRAKIVHDLIQHFKPDINTLVALSNGQALNVPPVQPPRPQPTEQQIADKVIAEREQAKFMEDAQSTLAVFEADPANEFLPDVKLRMSKLIEAGLVEGESITEIYQNAYALAVSQDKSIQEVLKARTAAQAATPPARQAPRSVKPSLGTGRANAPVQKFTTARDAVTAAFDQLSR